ncbi:MAG: M15 family metallopeptidase [Clostridiales bacterium]|nr:M15 family metallopeptidase [Clostridiales bacterium]
MVKRIEGKSYKEGADIPLRDLRYIRVLHRGFDGKTHIGEMIVNKAIALDVIDIFKELYRISYPIEKMLLIDEYDADDIKSMEDNNSSAFNYRYIEGTNKRSVHSDGLAIDINPLYNPYVRTRNGKTEVLPESGLEYTDRNLDNEYYIKKGDPCYEAFISRGFTWGGEWKNSKDYQHFEKKLAQE